MKAQFRIRLSDEGVSLLKELAKRDGIRPSSMLEIIIRQTARERGVKLKEEAAAAEADLYSFHPWMRQIADYARPLEDNCPEGLAAEDVLQGVFDKSLRQQTAHEKRVAVGCLRRLGWIDRNKDGVWFPPRSWVDLEASRAL